MNQLTKSYVHGASAIPLIGETIGAFFDQAAERWADREALVVRHQSIRWTYATLQQRVDVFAAGFLALGLRPGDRIGIWSPNNIEWVITQFASAKAGLILVTINPAYRLNELEFALNKVSCKALVTAATFKTSNYMDMLMTLAPEIASQTPGQSVCERVPSLTTLICIGAEAPGFFRFDAVAGMAEAHHHAQLAKIGATLNPTDPINIQFTSGTTGSPRPRRSAIGTS